MSGITKSKNEREKNEKLSVENSMKIGIMSMIAVMISLIIDAIAIFVENVDGISAFCGVVFLIFFGFFIKSKCIEKVRNKEYLRRVIDAGTLSSVFTFVIERTFMPMIKNADVDVIVSVLIVIIMFILLPVILFVLLRKKKEWQYYVD